MSDLGAGILLAIVSALVNGLIVGGIILFFEYRIKQRFAEFEKSLEKEAFEHETRFTKLHEKRAEVIAELYKYLVRLQRDLRALTLAACRRKASGTQMPQINADKRDKICVYPR
jgi:Na+-translocating ferredoxin:NAD+ oxidoreductase RnfG subunit